MTTHVTHAAKCYVFVCAGCGLLADSMRSDALTCSTRCRVRAHRSGYLTRIRALAAQWKIPPASLLQVDAIARLRPDMLRRIQSGELDLDDVRDDVARAYLELVIAAVEEGR